MDKQPTNRIIEVRRRGSGRRYRSDVVARPRRSRHASASGPRTHPPACAVLRVALHCVSSTNSSQIAHCIWPVDDSTDHLVTPSETLLAIVRFHHGGGCVTRLAHCFRHFGEQSSPARHLIAAHVVSDIQAARRRSRLYVLRIGPGWRGEFRPMLLPVAESQPPE